MVHWTLCLQDRFDGWLDDAFHYAVREWLLHTCLCYDLACSLFTLMPDHLHVLLLGLVNDSDQALALRFFRKCMNERLATLCRARLQKQGYDRVLRKEERAHDAFQKVAWYILENPVRANLVEKASDWPYRGCMVPGHPQWCVFHETYWDTFWDWYGEHASYDA